MAELACIGCGRALEHRAFQGFPVEQCDACGGVWHTDSTENPGRILFWIFRRWF